MLRDPVKDARRLLLTMARGMQPSFIRDQAPCATCFPVALEPGDIWASALPQHGLEQ